MSTNRSRRCTLVPNCITVDQLMWRMIVHHIPRWREPSPLRDFMRRLWPFTLWNVDCMHAKWQIRWYWIAGYIVVWEIVRIQSFWGPWNNRQDVVDDSAEYGTPWNVNTRDVADDFLLSPQTPQKTANQWKIKQFESQTDQHIWWIKCHGMYGYICISCPNESRNLWDCNSPLAKLTRPIGTMYLVIYYIHSLGGSHPDHCAILPAIMLMLKLRLHGSHPSAHILQVQ